MQQRFKRGQILLAVFEQPAKKLWVGNLGQRPKLRALQHLEKNQQEIRFNRSKDSFYRQKHNSNDHYIALRDYT